MIHAVYLAGRELRFEAADDETILEAGLRQHLTLPFGCKSGGCASCRVRLLRGTVAHRVPPPALSSAELDAGYILMCLAEARSELVIDLHQPARLERLRPRQLPVRALGKTALSHDVIGLTLKLPKGEVFDYLPGQYVDFLLEGGKRRSFSLATPPNGETLELHLRVTPGGQFAHWVQHGMPERAILRLEGPLGAFYIREDSERPILLMAGGTGFAPVKAMIEDQLAKASTRPMHLFWGVRSREDLYLDALARQWAREHPERFRYTPVLSEPARDTVPRSVGAGAGGGDPISPASAGDRNPPAPPALRAGTVSDPDADWSGEHGYVHAALLRTYPLLAGREVYMSGPPVMVRKAKDAFLAAGLDADHLFYDSFDYAFETWPQIESAAARP